MNGVRDLDVYIEQPCNTYEECRSVREHTNLPFVIDECIQDIGDMVKILSDRSADVVNLKIGKLGGLTKAKAVGLINQIISYNNILSLCFSICMTRCVICVLLPESP